MNLSSKFYTNYKPFSKYQPKKKEFQKPDHRVIHSRIFIYLRGIRLNVKQINRTRPTEKVMCFGTFNYSLKNKFGWQKIIVTEESTYIMKFIFFWSKEVVDKRIAIRHSLKTISTG